MVQNLFINSMDSFPKFFLEGENNGYTNLRCAGNNVCCEMWTQRRRQIEAINGAWAMIGLTAGLVIEGQTGKGILAQVKSYSFLTF